MLRTALCALGMVLVGLSWPCVSPHVDAAETDMVDEAIAHFAAQLRSDRAQQAVRQCAEDLKSATTAGFAPRAEAILFFVDMRAKGVLLALLRSDDRSARDFVADRCLGVFDVEDIPALYDIAVSLVPETIVGGGEEIAAREQIVRKLALATSRILGIEHVPLTSFSREAVHDWWLAAIKKAEKAQEGRSGLERIRRHFEE